MYFVERLFLFILQILAPRAVFVQAHTGRLLSTNLYHRFKKSASWSLLPSLCALWAFEYATQCLFWGEGEHEKGQAPNIINIYDLIGYEIF